MAKSGEDVLLQLVRFRDFPEPVRLTYKDLSHLTLYPKTPKPLTLGLKP